jgi:hypothetical protein
MCVASNLAIRSRRQHSTTVATTKKTRVKALTRFCHGNIQTRKELWLKKDTLVLLSVQYYVRTEGQTVGPGRSLRHKL